MLVWCTPAPAAAATVSPCRPGARGFFRNACRCSRVAGHSGGNGPPHLWLHLPSQREDRRDQCQNGRVLSGGSAPRSLPPRLPADPRLKEKILPCTSPFRLRRYLEIDPIEPSQFHFGKPIFLIPQNSAGSSLKRGWARFVVSRNPAAGHRRPGCPVCRGAVLAICQPHPSGVAGIISDAAMEAKIRWNMGRHPRG